VQPGVGQVRFGLDSRYLQHLQPSRLLERVVEERRLPDPGLPVQDEHAAAADAGVVQQAVDPGALLPTTDQHRSSVLPLWQGYKTGVCCAQD
jgi:hypothetical protein